MTCLRAPTSLMDAETIIETCAGPNWRSSFVLGLQTALAIIVIVGLTIWVLKR